MIIKFAIVILAGLGAFFLTSQVPALHATAFSLGTTAFTWGMCFIAASVGGAMTLSAKK